jgi:mono/diheme cytochrome c family protein
VLPLPTRCAVATLLAALALAACAPQGTLPTLARPAGTSASPAGPDLAAAEKAAYERARPVFEKHCRRCHAPGGEKATAKSLGHFSMDGYPFGGHHAASAGAAVREVLGVSGEAASMPADDPGAVKGDELDAVIAWSKAFDQAHPPAKPTPEP